MREIKFDYIIRGSDGKCYHCPYSLQQIEESTKLAAKKPGDIIARRLYTGLKDKDGVEIWEGDVVVIDNFNDGDAHEVKFGEYQTSEEHMLCWFYESRSALGLLSIANPCEVIGNIYENPELIK